MENKTSTPPDFSIVIPVYNEEENIPELYKRLTAVMETLGTYEIIMVDDGSRDRSWELIKELHHKDPRIKGISFSRNFGHHMAITAGLDHVNGSIIIMMDADLQDSPEEIPRLYQKFKEGYDIVYGIRKVRRDPFLKRLTSAIFWWFLGRFSGVDMPAGQTMLRVLSRRVVTVLREMREYARFIHGMIAWTGFNATTMDVQHNPRYKGRSKYNIPRLFKLAFHAVTSFSIVPLRLATYMGLISSIVSFLAGLYFIYKKIFFNIPILGYASIIVSIFFVGGIQLLVLGIFGEYLGRTYQEVQRRPLYIVKEFLLENDKRT